MRRPFPEPSSPAAAFGSSPMEIEKPSPLSRSASGGSIVTGRPVPIVSSRESRKAVGNGVELLVWCTDVRGGSMVPARLPRLPTVGGRKRKPPRCDSVTSVRTIEPRKRRASPNKEAPRSASVLLLLHQSTASYGTSSWGAGRGHAPVGWAYPR